MTRYINPSTAVCDVTCPGGRKVVDPDNAENFSEETAVVPTEYSFVGSNPNPFNPTTTIVYEIPENVFVSVVVYDMLGREVRTLVSRIQEAGHYEVTFNASDLPTGLYLYRIQAGNFSAVKKMMLMK